MRSMVSSLCHYIDIDLIPSLLSKVDHALLCLDYLEALALNFRFE